MISANPRLFLCNGEIKKSSEYSPEILSRGLSIYEVMRIINGTPVFFKEHYDRLLNSAKMLSFDLWKSKDEIIHEMEELTRINNSFNGNIEIIFHRSESGEQTFLCLFIEAFYPTTEMLEKGVPGDLYHGERENPNAKIVNLDLRIKTNKQISKCKLYEVILVDRNGFITEGSRSNVFFIKGETVYTPPVSEVLPGITRLKVFQICKKNHITLLETPIKADTIEDYEAAFFTGTSPGVLPISKVGKVKFNAQHQLMQKLVSLFLESIAGY